MSNTHSTSGGTSSVYRGVRKRRWGKWVSEILEPLTKTRIWLGSFDSPEMAAVAYDAASFYFQGDVARLNFPQIASTLPLPASSGVEDIRLAANEAALLLKLSTPESNIGSSSPHFVPANIGLTASQIQAINDTPFDPQETWMEFNTNFDPELNFYDDANFDHMNKWNEIPDDSLWEP